MTNNNNEQLYKEFKESVEEIDNHIKELLMERKKSGKIPDDKIQTPVTKSIGILSGLVENLNERLKKIEEKNTN